MQLRQASLLGFLALSSAAWPLLASAQTVGWMDRLFTFREDQRPNVTGAVRRVNPNYVYQPAYNPNDHVPWSQFYTRTDLIPMDGLAGSASKVMRPAPAQAPHAYGPPMRPNTMVIGAPLHGAAPNIQIGDPGQGWGMQQGQANVGRATRIDDPVHSWREEADPRLTSRPGDFDYEGGRADGQVLAETAPRFSLPVIGGPGPELPTRTVREPFGPYRAFNEEGQVTAYEVQRGDTLGGIAAQPEIYNESRLWPLIYSANRGVIGGNPNRLKPKMELEIPRDYTEAQARAARQRSGR